LASSAAVLLGLVIYLAFHLVLLKGVAPNEVVKTTLTLMAGLAAVLTGVYAYRKQRLSEADGARADADQGRADADQTRADQVQLTQRYSGAAEQLGHEKAAVRLAGVFAMARLADDWPKQRQQCIDVLCAYLRMPAEDDADLSEGQVRATIVRTITTHLHDDSAISWAEHDFDFTGATLHDADFSDATFSGKFTSFEGVTFSGGYTNFEGATFSGERTSFERATFSGAMTSFEGATFSGAITNFAGVTFSGESIIFYGATFSGEFTIFEGATFSGETASFAGVRFSGEYTIFDKARFYGERTIFDRARFSGERTSFGDATFSGERTSFGDATFSGGTPADEATAKASFLGGTVHWGPITPRIILPSTATGTH
jgi:uncharacterized protein YjbI with pentapeptide repeats